jgi:uncharacterized membrane protein
MARLTKKSANCCIHIKEKGTDKYSLQVKSLLLLILYQAFVISLSLSLSLSRMHSVRIISTFLHPDILREMCLKAQSKTAERQPDFT